jgi:hypothetical protein
MTEPPIPAAPFDPPPPTPYVDRSGTLVAFGIFELLIGAICCLLVVFLLAGAVLMARAPVPSSGVQPMSLQQAAGAALFYVLAAVGFAILGVGSIRARRWARTLSLIVAWMWLAGGCMGILFLILAGKGLFSSNPAMATLGPQAVPFFVGCMVVGFGALFILLPGLLVLGYGHPNVKATVEAKDPVVRWTDRCPAPVLALSLGFAFNVLFLPLGFPYRNAFPFFGTVVTGAAGALLRLALAGICAFLAWGFYRLRTAAWWGALALWLFGIPSSFLSFRNPAGLRELYTKMGYPSAQVDQMIRLYQGLFGDQTLLVLLGVVIFASLAYLLWVRRYFASPR